MPNVLSNVPVYNGSLFTWRKSEGYADVSDFDTQVSYPFAPLYVDGVDKGFQVCSPKTGDVKTFSLVHVYTDSEDDVTHWIFKSSDGFTITVFND